MKTKDMIVGALAAVAGMLVFSSCTSYDTLGGIRTEQVALPD